MRSDMDLQHSSLNPRFFDNDGKINPEIRKRLLIIARDFYKDTELQQNISDVLMLGSLAGYTYNEQSDIDLHIVIDFSKLDAAEQYRRTLVNSFTNKWNTTHDIKLNGHKIEIYLQDTTERNRSDGIYSLVKNEWSKQPSTKSVDIDKEDIKQKYHNLVKLINNAIQTDSPDDLKALLKQISDIRDKALDSKKKEFSNENILFKLLRFGGHLKRLKDSISEKYDSLMSLKEIGGNPRVNPIAKIINTINQKFLSNKDNKVYGGGRPANRQLKDVYDINCGYCEDWAEEVREEYRKQTGNDSVEVVGVGNLTGNPDDDLEYGHVFLKLDNKFYDAETPEGVDDWRDLPLIKNKAVNEGYGYKNPEEDPLHIADERWRIKWGSRKTPLNEVTQKDINQVHPSSYDTKNHKLEKLTLDNLKALREKAGREYKR